MRLDDKRTLELTLGMFLSHIHLRIEALLLIVEVGFWRLEDMTKVGTLITPLPII